MDTYIALLVMLSHVAYMLTVPFCIPNTTPFIMLTLLELDQVIVYTSFTVFP
jgi:hypothetical protein